MEVNVEVISTLERKLTVKIPSDNLSQKIEQKINELAPKVQIAGFRAGKVPPKIVKQRYGEAIRGEIIGDILRETFPKALEQENLTPAGMPQMEVVNADEGQPLEYVATFEIYPTVTINPISELKVEKIIAEVNDADIENMLQKLQKQHVKWNEVQRAAKQGDQLVIDFEGSIDGESFAGNKSSNFQLELGSGNMIPGFEDELLGVKAGDERQINVTFPKDYHAAALAGKKAVFDIKVHKVSEPELSALDDEFAKTVGVDGGLAGLKAEIQKTMERELNQSVRFKNREHVFAEFLKHNAVELPKTMVSAEFDRIKSQTKEMLQQRTGDVDPDVSEHEDNFQQLAERRVALSILLGEFVKQYQIETDKELVKQLVEEVAGGYHQPQQVIDWYYRNKEQLAQIESAAIEQQVVEKIYSEATVAEKKLPYEEAVKPEEES